jgi:tetratricopeptide (TPR) repeat protein
MRSEVRQVIQQATSAYEAGQYAEAERLLLQVVDRAPTYANVFNMLGFIASQRNALEEAVALFRRALGLNPNYSEARLNLALTLAEMGAYEQAAQEAASVHAKEAAEPQRISPVVRGKLANAHADLGGKYHALGLYAEAVAEFDKALGLCPGYPDIHNRRALSCRELGRYAEAKASLLRAIEVKPNYVEAHVNLGILYHKLGSLSEAVDMLERALQLDPDHRVARVYLKQLTTTGPPAETP